MIFRSREGKTISEGAFPLKQVIQELHPFNSTYTSLARTGSSSCKDVSRGRRDGVLI